MMRRANKGFGVSPNVPLRHCEYAGFEWFFYVKVYNRCTMMYMRFLETLNGESCIRTSVGKYNPQRVSAAGGSAGD